MSSPVKAHASTSVIVMQPVQWANLPHIDDVDPVTDIDCAVFQEIREVLQRHGATARFGINLLHRHFNMASDEILVEYTDEIARTQICKVESIGSFEASGNRIETNWVFDRDGATVVCKGGCVYDRGHRRRHI